jgi:hypothetical protein
MSESDLIGLITQGGAVAVLAVGVVAFLRGWIVPGSLYERTAAERDRWEALAVDLLKTAARAVTLAEKST